MYHIVFIPKYRRKAMYGQYRADMGEDPAQDWRDGRCAALEGKVCIDHVHMYMAIPPKMAVSDFIAKLKGKSALMFF